MTKASKITFSVLIRAYNSGRGNVLIETLKPVEHGVRVQVEEERQNSEERVPRQKQGNNDVDGSQNHSKSSHILPVDHNRKSDVVKIDTEHQE